MWKKDIVNWKVGKTLYLSIPFSWLLGKAEIMARKHNGPVEIGGAAAILNKDDINWATVKEQSQYDVLSLNNPLATFTTRGCIRSCSFCAVNRLEGNFRELVDWKPNPIVCDNNFIAASKYHIKKVVDTLKVFPYVDFNQGLDARIFSSWHADQLARLKGVKVRFAMDHSNQIGKVSEAIKIARNAGLKDFGVYVLVGFKDTPEDALNRLEMVRGWGIWPTPMRYQPLDTKKKNSFVGENWTDFHLKRMVRYYSKLAYLEHIPFDEYVCGAEPKDQLSMFGG